MSVRPDSEADAPRRTELAAERTWLAWWRSGIAAATAAVAVGGVVPELVDGSRTPYIVLGAGYAALAAVTFIAAGMRQRRLERALGENGFERAPLGWVMGLTFAGAALALATLAIVVIQP
jgi:putative membrane protein